jgi:5-deoxy-glucuronate isomerase
VSTVGHPLHIPHGASGDGRDEVVVTPESAGWGYAGIRVVELTPGEVRTLSTGPDEMVAIPLAGACVVECDGVRFELAGRRDVFSGVSDFAYLPMEASVLLSSTDGARVALPSARARRRLQPAYGPAGAVPVEIRGAGRATRQMHNFCGPTTFEADKLVAVECITPAGNWSSWPPHKHDEDRPGEAVLEEIYYFEVARGGIGYQRAYGTPGRPQDLLAEVRTGDVVTIPHGWHGPSMAAPGYDLYYLNVMAGPGERAWLFRDDPGHAWVRDTWAGQPADPRLPMTGPGRTKAGPNEAKDSPSETKDSPNEAKDSPSETKDSPSETMTRPGGDAG